MQMSKNFILFYFVEEQREKPHMSVCDA